MSKGKKTTERGYGWAWQQLRLQVFEAYGRQCHLALLGCTSYATSVDHLDPIKYAGTDVPPLDRCRPACRSCNSRKGARLQQYRPPPLITSRKWY